MIKVADFFQYILERKEQILNLLVQHIYLSVLAVLIAVLIGIPIGVLIARHMKLSKPIIGLANLVQAIPSLALLGFLIPFVGIGSKPAIIMVVLYSLLPIIKNTYTGLMNIDGNIIEAATGIGLTKNQILTKVQLPLALPMIMAGIRISAVTAVGLMTIAAFVGAGGLGYLVFSGVQTVDNQMILAGAIPACMLALLIDFLIGKIENGISFSTKKSKKSGIFQRRWVQIASMGIILCFGATVLVMNMNHNKEKTIVVGSKNFTEQLIVGNMISDVIEYNTDFHVKRKLNLGGSQVAFSALTSGELDVYVEYTGTGLVNILKEDAVSDSDQVYNIVQKEFHDKYQLKWLEPLGFNNTYALAVRQDTAEKYNLKTISDLANVSKQLIMGPTIEFPNRSDGLIGLKEVYNLEFKKVAPVDGGLRYTALNSGESEVIDAFSTDGLLREFNLSVLEDDKKFFPPYYAAPLIREDTLEEYPELESVINKLAAALDDETMRELNYKVDSLKEAPAQVAEDFLKEKGLIK
ncbi:ABC transporter permease/substrate-binding protein [Anaeromicropila populeti]|uniref:Osmoprotectant transport system permease protein n=1 Tax=Anaeromicropila populeti TaxID=37658 RepID=A0A1I6IQ95_9FIRM|nr:glycine betaine ABC transporter substrate-binding protein [Anaeromicropila populeti]SFR68888.1 osmoprotectant transport system permease protein [Anaeromicropila populeti]